MPENELITEIPTDIGRRKKHQFLQTLTEDDFRDRVVRPVFERLGLIFVRDTCGPDEEGKDCIFLGKELLGKTLVYAVQTKRGNLNLSSKVAGNVVSAEVQLRTALETDLYLTSTKEKVRPDRVLLVASGGINNAARRHIQDRITDPRIQIMDASELVPMIDKLYPELWFGIDAQKFPYLRRLKEELLKSSDTIAITELGIEGKPYSPITQDTYVTLYIQRVTEEIVKNRGKVERRPKLEQFPVADIIKRKDRLICITGEGGSGKTTALRRLGLQLVDDALSGSHSEHLPILLKASEISSGQRIVAIAANATARLSPNDRPAFNTEDLENGKIVVLIDALDEISNESQRIQVLNNIEEFNAEFKNCFVILTSRDYSSIQKLVQSRALFVRYQLSSIDLRQAGKIVDRLAGGKRLAKEDAKEMLRRLQDVHGISLNPMLVTVFVATSDYSKKDIPPNITEIFKKFTEMMLGRWDERKGLAQQYHAPLKDFLLRQLASAMHRKYERSISLEKCRELMAAELVKRGHDADVDVLSHEIIYRSNLLRVDDDRVEFRHHLLQEFFAGRSIVNAAHVTSVVGEEWWRKPIVFYFGEHPENHEGIAVLMEAADLRKPTEAFEAAVTIGLANQACYLAEIADKLTTFEWVIRTFASTCEDVIASYISKKGSLDLYMFIAYYLTGREAVASDYIKHVADRMEASDVQNECELFWCIAGLLESGHLGRAEELLKDFKPTDQRLLLALHMGAFFISNERISTPEQKKIASRICDRIAPKISHLMKAILDQWKSYLLEMRDGEIRVIPRKTETADASQPDQ